MNTMTYRGHVATVEYRAEDECLVGRVVGISDFVSFHGSSVRETRRAFRAAVDDYLQDLAESNAAKPVDGPALRAYRKRQGLTQEQLAAQLEVTKATITEWERCKRPLPGTMKFALAAVV